MTRMLPGLVAGVVLIGLLGACGTPEPMVGAASRGKSGTPVSALPTAVPPTLPPVPVPTVNPATDPLAQRALAHAREQSVVRSGEPTVRLSRSVTLPELRALGFGSWNFTPGCEPPMHLVILQGDFDMRSSMPASLPTGVAIPAAFIIYVYDLRLDEIVSTFGDPDGQLVRSALGDPSLPNVDRGSLPNPEHPGQLPCAPTGVPGAPAGTPQP